MKNFYNQGRGCFSHVHFTLDYKKAVIIKIPELYIQVPGICIYISFRQKGLIKLYLYQNKTEKILIRIEPGLKEKFQISLPKYVNMSEKIRRLIINDLKNKGYDVSLYDY